MVERLHRRPCALRPRPGIRGLRYRRCVWRCVAGSARARHAAYDAVGRPFNDLTAVPPRVTARLVKAGYLRPDDGHRKTLRWRLRPGAHLRQDDVRDGRALGGLIERDSNENVRSVVRGRSARRDYLWLPQDSLSSTASSSSGRTAWNIAWRAGHTACEARVRRQHAVACVAEYRLKEPHLWRAARPEHCHANGC